MGFIGVTRAASSYFTLKGKKGCSLSGDYKSILLFMKN